MSLKSSLLCLSLAISILLSFSIPTYSAPASGRQFLEESAAQVDCSKVTDQMLKTSVQNKFRNTKELLFTHIRVSVSKGVVTLSDIVLTQDQKDKAQQVAASVACVKEVINKIVVTGSGCDEGDTVCCGGLSCAKPGHDCPTCTGSNAAIRKLLTQLALDFRKAGGMSTEKGDKARLDAVKKFREQIDALLKKSKTAKKPKK
jgi:hypothetical protein